MKLAWKWNTSILISDKFYFTSIIIKSLKILNVSSFILFSRCTRGRKTALWFDWLPPVSQDFLFITQVPSLVLRRRLQCQPRKPSHRNVHVCHSPPKYFYCLILIIFYLHLKLDTFLCVYEIHKKWFMFD